MTTAPYTAFGQTRVVDVVVYRDSLHLPGETGWDETLWVERAGDWYALHSPQLRGKRVRIVTRKAWLRAEVQP